MLAGYYYLNSSYVGHPGEHFQVSVRPVRCGLHPACPGMFLARPAFP